MLKEQPTKENAELRQWAIAVLDKNSPVAIPASLKSQLTTFLFFDLVARPDDFAPEEKIECRPVPSAEVLEWLIASEPTRYTRCPNGQVGLKSLDFSRILKRPRAPASAQGQWRP